MKITLPENVKWITDTLQRAGFEAYAVGGCVRDSLLLRVPNDWDITTSALPNETKELFKRTVDTGIEHGTVTVMIDKEGYEVTTYRVDGKYSDSRHPDRVTFTPSLKEDLKRRDFTINAMAYNDVCGMVDLFGGEKDLEDRVVRCVGNPSERFTEDALRILRAYRFAAQLDFTIDPETEEAAKKLAAKLVNISAERVHVELDKLICSKRPDKLEDLLKTGIAEYIIPELKNADEDLFKRLYNSAPDRYIRWALLFESIGGAQTVMRRLKFDNHTMHLVKLLVSFAEPGLEEFSEAELRRAMYRAGARNLPLIFEFYSARYPEADISKVREKYEIITERHDATSLKELELNGRDLIEELGVEKGRKVGEILESLLERVLKEPELNRRETLLLLAKKAGARKNENRQEE